MEPLISHKRKPVKIGKLPIFTPSLLFDSGPSRVSEIAMRMGVASNYASQYKRRLLEDGVIGERGRGLVGFDIPAFREFLSEKAF